MTSYKQILLEEQGERIIKYTLATTDTTFTALGGFAPKDALAHSILDMIIRETRLDLLRQTRRIVADHPELVGREKEVFRLLAQMDSKDVGLLGEMHVCQKLIMNR